MGKVVLKGEAMHHTEPLREQVCNMGKDKTAHVLTIQKMPRLENVCLQFSKLGWFAQLQYHIMSTKQNRVVAKI